MSETIKTDVTIIGAGLVGLSAAVAMRQAGYSVVVVDAKSPANIQLAEDAWDTRIYAISPRNAAWLRDLNIWQNLNLARIGRMQAMEIFGEPTLAPIHLLADDVNADDLGFIVEASALSQALLKQVASSGIQTLFNAPCNAIQTSESSTILTLENGQVITCSLLIAADSSQSWVRSQLNLPLQHKSYAQSAIVANFKVEKPHGNVARQWFSIIDGKNSILAWLPLPDNTISIVWSVSTNMADNLLKLSNDAFTAQVQEAGGALLGELKLLGTRAVFPLVMQKSDDYWQQSVVFMGDAAHKIHPMAGQGVNLGFRDVMDFMEILNHKNAYQTLNDASLLKKYARKRKVDMLNMLLLTDGLYQLFESQNKVVKKVRHWGMSATNHKVIKKMLVENAIAL
ncbi:MAG TPA: FAD-dependent monooxygenase [Methylotenera sp.]|nr:FAD-dependent monooxygenase [Methylotenera sp.]HPH06015.1 FAD-dependent monooxygenase [Methylotenera sp.]HPN00593.1 FAD-dependent monooxygenase [Methylotenera sp.]